VGNKGLPQAAELAVFWSETHTDRRCRKVQGTLPACDAVAARTTTRPLTDMPLRNKGNNR
jgi:hypothetical protein